MQDILGLNFHVVSYLISSQNKVSGGNPRVEKTETRTAKKTAEKARSKQTIKTLQHVSDHNPF